MQDRDFPALYGAANAASMASQKNFFRALFWSLFALVVAAILSVINKPGPELSYAQICALFISLGCTIYLAAKQPQKIWYGGRALAESVKTVTWRYMMKAEPYDNDSAADRKFTKSLKELLDSNKEVSKQSFHQANTDQVTQSMQATRMLSLADRKTLYQNTRIDDQLKWYTRKALYNKRHATGYFISIIALNILAIGFAISKLSFPNATNWPTDIFIAATGAVIAWVQAKRYQDLATSYTLTAHDIGILKASQQSINDEKKFSSFVGDAENAFSREHTQWQARRDHN